MLGRPALWRPGIVGDARGHKAAGIAIASVATAITAITTAIGGGTWGCATLPWSCRGRRRRLGLAQGDRHRHRELKVFFFIAPALQTPCHRRHTAGPSRAQRRRGYKGSSRSSCWLYEYFEASYNSSVVARDPTYSVSGNGPARIRTRSCSGTCSSRESSPVEYSGPV